MLLVHGFFSRVGAQELTGRLAALGRAHDLVRPIPGNQGHAALLGDLLSVPLSPYEDLGAFKGRIRVAPRMGVGEAAATALSLIFHELATNSLKYGALSVDTGTLDLSGSTDDDEVTLTWTERDGPAVESPNGAPGLRKQAAHRGVSGQLCGTVAYDWRPRG